MAATKIGIRMESADRIGWGLNRGMRFWGAVGELDFWLRSDGHRRNPGTTADWMAASLFVAMFNRDIDPSIVPEYRW